MKIFLEKYISFIIYIVILYFIINLPNYIFRDRDSYVYYAGYYNELLEYYLDDGIQYLIANEPLFLLINKYLAIFLSPESIPIFFTALTFSIFFLLLFKFSKNLVMLIFGLILYFTITYTFHLQFVILRQSLSTFLFLLVLCYVKDFKKILFSCIVLGFIHSSFLFISLLMIVNYFSSKFIKKEIVRVIFQIILFFSLGYIALILASYLGFRQAEGLIDSEVDIGGGAWILWLVVTLYLLFFGNRDNKILYEYSLVGMLAFLSMYFSTPFIGRLVASFIPAIILIIVSRCRKFEIIIILLILTPYIYLVSSGVLYNLSFAVNSYELNSINFFSD